MKSIFSLPPVLQEVWSRVYAAGVSSELSRYSIDSETSPPSDESIATWAENHAWEAVRRAKGGEMPNEQEGEEEKRLAILNEAVKQPCPVTGEPFFMVLKHPDLGWVPTYGGPHDSWTAPERDRGDADEGLAPMLFRYHYDHDEGAWGEYEAMGMRAVVTTRPADEPTDEEMAEALAPTVAELSHGPLAWGRNKPFHETWVEHTRQCLAGIENTWSVEFRQHCAIALASWKAARTWNRK